MSDTDAGLKVELFCDADEFETSNTVELRARFSNVGSEALTLTFWWNRKIELRDASGATVEPGSGPVLPCGIPEEPTVIEPGGTFERSEGLACTQPGGASETIGWSYALAPGEYRARLVFAYPPAHGRGVRGDAHWQGRVESNEVAFRVLRAEPPRKRGFFARLFGG